jgi:hypothetical protein
MISIWVDELEDFLELSKRMSNTVIFRKKGNLNYHELWFLVESAHNTSVFSCTASTSEIDDVLEGNTFAIIDAELKHVR